MKKQGKNRIFFYIICAVCFLFLIGNFLYGLNGRKEEIPENPIQGISETSSMVGYLGKGYSFGNLEQEQQNGEYDQEELIPEVLEEEPEDTEEPEREEEEYQEIPEEPEEQPEEQPEKQPEAEIQETFADQYNNGEEPGDNGADVPEEREVPVENIYEDEDSDMEIPSREDSPDDDSNQDGADVPEEPVMDPNEGKYPEIASDLVDGETVNDTYRAFFVQAVDYAGQVIPSSGLEVYGNGERLYSVSDRNDMTGYRMDLLENENYITIKAADSEGRSTTVEYLIYKGEEGEPVSAGSITFSLEAGTLGLGYLIAPQSVEFYQGEQLSYVISRAIQEAGYEFRFDGSLDSGFYLKHIVRGGITQGYSIPDEILTHLEEVNCPIEDFHWDSLGEFDFTKNSGWLYFVNGEYMNSGISTYFPADGDEVRIRFSLYAGADVGGGMNGVTWGDW